MSVTTREVADHTLTLGWVREATGHFVQADEMREAISLALAAGLNFIFSGEGGHGKSEFIEAVFGAVGGTIPFVKSLGQGTSSEELYGGIDFDALNRDSGATLQFNPTHSFLGARLAVFEELFDAPPRVLTSLKDTLTAKALRNGGQQFKMLTRVIAAATNHSPQAIAEGGTEIAALVERFPIQLEVKWDSYDEEAYFELLETVDQSHETTELVMWDEVAALQGRTAQVVVGTSMKRLLARIIGLLRKDRVVISPRTAVLAMRLIRAAAVINGRDQVEPDDLLAMCYLPGVCALGRDFLKGLIDEHAAGLLGEEKLSELEARYAAVLRVSEEDYDAEALQILELEARQIHTDVGLLRVGSGQAERRLNLVRSSDKLLQKVRNQLNKQEMGAKLDEHKQRLIEIKSEAPKLHRSLRHADKDKALQLKKQLAAFKREVDAMVVHPDLQELHDEVQTLMNMSLVSRR